MCRTVQLLVTTAGPFGTQTLPRHRSLHDTLLSVGLHDYSVLTQLLLYQNDLFSSIDDEITAWIEGAFVQQPHIFLLLICQYTVCAPQHKRESPDRNTTSLDVLLAARVHKVDEYRCRVCHVT